jgi:hypothetical protein
MAVVTCLADIAEKVKIDEAPWKAFLVLLGDPADPEELAGIPKDMFIKYVTDFEFKVAENAHKLTPVQVGRMSKCYDAISDKLTKGPFAVGPVPSTGAAKTDVPETAVKLAHIMNEALEGYVIRPSNEVVNKLLTVYQSRCGGMPREQVEPTADQLGGLLQVLNSGSAPYADFSLWGPQGRRALKKLIHSAALYDPNTGKWVQKSLRGPPNFQSWLKSWNVFKVAMIMLGQASSASLEAYEEKIRTVATEDFPAQCWFLVYQADVRARSEYWDKFLRITQLEQSKKAIDGFDADMPWDYVIRFSVDDDLQRSRTWWEKELTRKCDGYLNGTLSHSQVIDDGSTLLLSSPPEWSNKRGGGPSSEPRPPKRTRPHKDQRFRGPAAQARTEAASPETAIVPFVAHEEPWWWAGSRGKGGDHQQQQNNQNQHPSKGGKGDGKGKGKGEGKGKDKGKGDGKGKGKTNGKGQHKGK